MKDYYADFLTKYAARKYHRNELTEPTEEPPVDEISPFVGCVSSFSNNPEINERTVQGFRDRPIVTMRSAERRLVAGQAGGRDYVICECGKHAFAGHDCPYCGVPAFGAVMDENAIVRTVQEVLSDGRARVDEIVAIAAYNKKLAAVRADPELESVFHQICEERKAILIGDGGMNEQDAEAYVSDIRFLCAALLMT